MKFEEGDRVRVIAWAVPGVEIIHMSEMHMVCGRTGTVNKVRKGTPDDNSDGNYRVAVAGSGNWWFRACDLVMQDSECTCDDTIKKIPLTPCIIHDRPDPDPTSEIAAKLETLVHDLEADV